MGNLRLTSNLLEYKLSQLKHGEFTGVPEVHGTDDLLLLHEAHESLDKIVDIAEGAGLGPLAINSEILTLQGLNDEVGDNASIIGQHARTIGVENTDHSDIDAVFTVIVKEERLGCTLPFVVARTQANRVHVTPISLRLRMDIRITIYLGGGSLEDTCIDPLGKSEAVDGTYHRGLHRLDRIVLVVRGGSRAGKVIDAVHLELEWVDHIMANEFEAGIPHKMLDVGLTPGEEIVEADDFMPLLDEAVAKMGAKKSGSAGDEDAHWKKLKDKTTEGKRGKIKNHKVLSTPDFWLLSFKFFHASALGRDAALGGIMTWGRVAKNGQRVTGDG